MTNFYDKYMKYKTKYMELKSNAMEEGAMGTMGAEGAMGAEVVGSAGAEVVGSAGAEVVGGAGAEVIDGAMGAEVVEGAEVGKAVGGAGRGAVIGGSGVIIVSVVNGIPCILLPREKQKTRLVKYKMNSFNTILNNNIILSIDNFNIHEDIGGGIHYNHLPVEENTIFELYEETAGYIICDPNKLKRKILDEYYNEYNSYIDLEYRKGSIYRCYIIGIDSCHVNISQMNSNLHILNKYKYNVDNPFFECDSWTWFPIKNFTNNNNFVQAPHYKNIFHETYIIVNDIFNNPKFISSRTWKILLQSYNKQGIKGINLCYKIIKNINNFKLHNKGYNTTILPLLQNIPITSIYIS